MDFTKRVFKGRKQLGIIYLLCKTCCGIQSFYKVCRLSCLHSYLWLYQRNYREKPWYSWTKWKM